jgi:hypothetical protein
MPLDIDHLVPERSLIDLDNHSEGDFDIADGFVIQKLLDDVILCEYVDMTADGDNIMRNGIAIPLNTVTKAWRKAEIVIAGPRVKECKVGDIIIAANDYGMRVSRLPVLDENGKERIIKHGVFLNEARIFGICGKRNEGE